ncbi:MULTISPECIES: LytR/AlgR family response regulator transcription factor [Virgibacillus]|uniref:Regulator n=1 Tax=Virgibacillus pantothenticus TaxID=1473 RepID=A0A0L0QM39_VIRPA|nr:MULTISPECIES: LytTR family DNA-binding domain-containing protein [Virgibacillus]API93350.1 DNA-binding response regulator [Virgibacillus sp. 6R]KNE19621.1 regulator [Virgibacillus pantothenticus]MBS7428596.1 response regulator transcription factor [Virgibacillus sp. 19R1-5]MBU8567531.1 LytTR family DNA-binding domain-containing protein [Virgibacillus pantothenticus]MBU8601320.1 LytTR family DNA-binding domain-containing protein [Virgibacillus pantothenticus]
MKHVIKVLVVDDEKLNREELIYLLATYPNVEIVGQANSGESCIMEAMKKKPDLVFLDVEMPGMNGMETAASLMELRHPPLLVFATAYPQFAVQAFRYEAVDYLLKPYDENQLGQTISRIEKMLVGPEEREQEAANKLGIENEDGVFYADPTEILYVQSVEKQVKIVTKSNTFYTKKTLKDLEKRLNAFHFFRIHKSYLVNLNYVSQLTPWFNGAYNLRIAGRDEPLPVSRNYVKELREQLEL